MSEKMLCIVTAIEGIVRKNGHSRHWFNKAAPGGDLQSDRFLKTVTKAGKSVTRRLSAFVSYDGAAWVRC